MDRAALNRLRWRCTRRAFLELDLILEKFLATGFQSLNEEQQETFVELAELEDHQLWPLVNGKEECADSRWAEVLALVRQTEISCR